jgi:CBS domain containing-hemolysin-like protein
LSGVLVALIVVLCLLAEAFFSGSEIGVVSADRMGLRHAAAGGSRGARLALRMLENPEWLLSTTLVGTNVAIVTNTTVVTVYVAQTFGESWSWLSAAIVAPLSWIFGEIVAKGVFQQRADVLTPRVIYALKGASYLFSPILLVFTTLSRVVTRLVGGSGESSPFTLRQEIGRMVEMSAVGGDIPSSERSMIRRVFRIGETTARDVMVPLIDTICLDWSADVGTATDLARKTSHIRFPVYRERVDRIDGVINVLDLIQHPPGDPIEPLVLSPIFVPGSRPVEHLLHDLRRARRVLAVVVDEFGGAEGIVTLEDILEVLVGDIEDEFDQEEQPLDWIRKVAERDYRVGARVPLRTMDERLGIALPDGNYETLGGYLLEQLREIPVPGTVIRHRNVTFTVEVADERGISEVRVQVGPRT